MNYWRLLLLVFLAYFEPIASLSERGQVYGERRLLHEREKFCGKDTSCKFRNSLPTLYGNDKTPLQRERLTTSSLKSQDRFFQSFTDRQRLDRSQRQPADILTKIREQRNQDARNLARAFIETVRDNTERSLTRNVRNNADDRRSHSEDTRNIARILSQSTDSRRTREQRENQRERSSETHHQSQDRSYNRERNSNKENQRSAQMTRRENERSVRNTDELRNRQQSAQRIRATENVNDQRRTDNSRSRRNIRESYHNRHPDNRRTSREERSRSRRSIETRMRTSSRERTLEKEERILDVRFRTTERPFNEKAQEQRSRTRDRRFNERFYGTNVEDRRLLTNERKNSDKFTETTTGAQRMKFSDWQSLAQKPQGWSSSTILAYTLYTLQVLYFITVLYRIAGFSKSEKMNKGFFHLLAAPRQHIKAE